MVELLDYKLGDLRVLNNNIIILYGDNSEHIMKIHNTNSLDNIYNDDLTNLRTTTIRIIIKNQNHGIGN